MPTRLVKSFSKRTGKNISEVEKLWEKAKKSALSKYDQNDPEYFPYVVGIVKNMLGLKEEYLFLNKFKKLLS